MIVAAVYGLGRLSLGVLAVALCASTGCPSFQRKHHPDFPPPEKPGDKCRDRLDEGPTRSCPDGMECTGVRTRGPDVHAFHCALLPGRCAVSADCKPEELCIRNTLAIGYCAPSTVVSAMPH